MFQVPVKNILNNIDNYSIERPWSQRATNGFKCMMAKKVRRLLEKVSGNEVVELLKDVLKQDEIKVLAKKYYDALSNLSKPINEVKPKNKHVFIHQLKMADLRLSEILEMNYKCSRSLWASCKSTHERLVGGRPRISDEIVSEIKEILDKNSSMSSFQTVKVKKRSVEPSVSLFEPRLKKKKLDESESAESIVENVKFCRITMQEAKEELDKKYIELGKLYGDVNIGKKFFSIFFIQSFRFMYLYFIVCFRKYANRFR